MTWMQDHTLQLIWRFCAIFEKGTGHLWVVRQWWTRKDESWHACVHAWEGWHSQVIAGAS